MLSIGLMSGTSMDGIEVALLETDGTPTHLKQLQSHSMPYHPSFKILLKAAEYAIYQSAGDLKKAQQDFETLLDAYLAYTLKQPTTFKQALHAYLPLTWHAIMQHSTALHVEAIRQLLKITNHTEDQIDVVGYHGQTLFHRPQQKISIIIGNGDYLAKTLHLPVVNDFRSADIAKSGQGAPLAPLYHQALAIQANRMPSVFVNCGGIANITFIPSANENQLIGFDTGPGNGLIDRFIREKTAGREQMDFNGKYGAKGRVHPPLLKMLQETAIRQQDYIAKKPPKALDINDLQLIPALYTIPFEDAVRTLEAWTAESILQSIKHLPTIPKYWILSGGGWYNPIITAELKERLHMIAQEATIHLASDLHWQNHAIEAEAFAYLAVRVLKRLPTSLPQTTGGTEPTSGGKLHLPYWLFS